MNTQRFIKLILIFAVFAIGILGKVYAWDGTEPRIVDHRAVQKFDEIPDYWLERAKELTVHYAHTSHGSQVVCGLNWLETYIDPVKYKLKAKLTYGSGVRDPYSGLPNQENPPALCMWEEGSHPEDYWRGTAIQNSTIEVLDSGILDISGWSWCGEHGNTAIIEEYISAMMRLENECPHVTFFYMTGVTSPYRTQYNDMIRAHCQSNNKVLFDFADIEKHDPDGGYHGPDGRGDWCAAWVAQNPGRFQNIPPITEVGGGGDGWLQCSHAHGLYAIMKGRAFWYMMARLAGWDDGSDPDPDPDPDPDLGDVSGEGNITAYDASMADRHAAQLHTLTQNQRGRADVNKDGMVTATDAAQIARFAAGLISAF